MKKKAPKQKDAVPDSSSRGRGRGGFEARGRGRGAERGARGSTRGARTVSQTNGHKPTQVDNSWDDTAATNGDAVAAADDWANEPGKDKLESLATDKPKPAPSAAPASGKGGWAGLFAKTTPAAPPPKAESTRDILPEIKPAVPEPQSIPAESPREETEIVPPPIEPIQVEDGPSELPSAPHSEVGQSDLTPTSDELTKENVNKLPDVSQPVASATAASTVASADGPVNPALPNVTAIRPGMSGHAASALRATTATGRSASYSRKVMDQQEAVVMPGNHAVDRAAVQFGKMGLDAEDVDADDDREEPETRTQLPDDSPAAPRASLPPAPASIESQIPTQPQHVDPIAEAPAQAQRTPSGLPSAPHSAQEPTPPPQNAYSDPYARYAQKGYDPFSQQPQHGHTPTEPFSNQIPGQSQPNASQQELYNQYYGREYASYYGYGHNQGQEQQRSGSAFGTSAPDVQGQYASAGPRGYSQDISSGNNTPNPHAAGQQAPQSGQMQAGPGAHANYPYGQYGGNYNNAYPQYGSYGSMAHNNAGRYGANRPMFDDARRQASNSGNDEYYANQYGYNQNQGYSGSYGKSGMYSGPHQYSQHEYSTSPGNAAFAGREAYGRAGSTQPNDQQSNTGSNAYSAGMQDPFGRSPSGFGQHQHGGHSTEDPAKPGPSPSLQGGRPNSAAQGVAGQQQGGLPHGQSNQQAFGYPQYSGFGNQNNQHSGYGGGGYASNTAFAGYGAAGYGGRGGNWPGQYGSGQH